MISFTPSLKKLSQESFCYGEVQIPIEGMVSFAPSLIKNSRKRVFVMKRFKSPLRG